MVLLSFYLFLALGVSFLCSILEAVLFSVTPAYVESIDAERPRTAERLRMLKDNIDRPLSAILSLNTIAHTVGAAGVGAQALIVFGSAYVAVTSAVLTLLILVFSEIIPKTLGAYHWQKLAGFAAIFLPFLIKAIYPLVWLSELISRTLAPAEKGASVSREELQAMTRLARKEGLFGKHESGILGNVFKASHVRVKDVMTPRTVMFTLPASMTVADALRRHAELLYSRIPIVESNAEHLSRFTLKSDILLAAAQDQHDRTLGDLARPVRMIPALTSLVVAFEQISAQRQHIALVVDEYGSVVGLITLEDIVETLLGIEIVDETDEMADLQHKAREQWRTRQKELLLSGRPPSSDS